jgi:probable HAF family extracellular repeat protein
MPGDTSVKHRGGDPDEWRESGPKEFSISTKRAISIGGPSMRYALLKPKRLLSHSLLAIAVAPVLLGAQNPAFKHHPRYRLVDLGTLGGPISYGSADGPGGRILNNAGVVSSYADTTEPDPFAPDFCFDADCLVAHAYRWRRGVMQDLGSSAPGASSLVAHINDRGWGIGASETGDIDPLFGAPQNQAVVWTRSRMIPLGYLPGGTESIGVSINSAGQAVGFGFNGVADPYAPIPAGFQNRTFIWYRGEMTDIGTLGGPDALPGGGCDLQRPNIVVGASYTSYTPNQNTGVPTWDPFLWTRGVMIDLGNLGGTMSMAQCANNRGEVIGSSNLPGDQLSHAFLWRNGQMKDLGTLGGDISEAIWINDAGVIAGSADLPAPNIHDAVRWKDGKILDLGTVDGDACSRGRAINAAGVIVGGSSDCANFLHAFVWKEGGPMLDLNTLIPPGSGLQLLSAFNINARGEILVKTVPVGTPPNDDEDLGHVALLIPCEDDSPCENSIALSAGQTSRPMTRAVRSGSKNDAPVPDAWQSYRAIMTAKPFKER